MKITYWWRASLIIGVVLILTIAYIGPCDYALARCLGGNSILVTRTIFHFSLSLLAVSPFLFFVRDEVFKKWLRFAGVWFTIAAVLIAITPEYQGGWMSIGPTKESVSIWMGALFVIGSLAKLAWDSRKLK